MELINESLFPAAWIVGKLQPAQWSMTCLVKGTFQLNPDQVATLSEEQPDLTGDRHNENDINKLLLYPSDFAYYKPKVDVILKGTGYVPNSGISSALSVCFRVGNYEKVLMVVGNRTMDDRGQVSEPQQFKNVPLSYQYAYGGIGYAENPLGKGVQPISQINGLNLYDLPNILYPQNSKDSLTRSGPAGYGPISQTWPQRVAKMGTYDEVWLKQYWPWFPPDCDWACFNSAPEDQQLPGYLRGDEGLYFENMHPSHSKYRSKLPGWRVRCFIEERVRASIHFREVPMHLDTLFVDMDEEQMNLIWRGVAPVQTEKLEEILYLFVMVEPADEPDKPLEYYNDALVAALIKREEEDEELDEEEELEDEDTEEAELEEPEEELGAAPEDQALPPALVATANLNPIQTSSQTSEDTQPAQPPESGKNKGPQEETEDELGEEPEEPEEEDEDEDLTIDQLKKLIRQKASLEEAELSNLDLSEVDLSGINLRNAIFDQVILYKANLSDADLSGAMLAGLNLSETNCRNANFSGADLSEARLIMADLTNAIAQGTDFMKADMRHAKLAMMDAEGADFSEADLSDANLTEANLTGADLTDCKLHRTDLSRANLTEAALERAWGRNAQFEDATVDILKAAGANFCEGNFKRIKGKETVWEEGEYYGADFSGANIPGAEFSMAYLGWAKFNATDLTDAVFDEACLVSAEMVRTKLLNASIQKADLSQVNLFESNLYEANLCFSNLSQTNLEGANLRMLKHTMDR
ncbi:DUF2169 family type VI secretion system accessory protein [Methylosarcina fibrata]|uniref:DUF2169 family type VI secretion system accessory protein n=1 Tax=Methylosarcina fibrata TaxID=105972 RepID=UPI00036DFE65|nr:DUF2169 domain-containing protein [Methylosarcina fibrata]